MSRIRIVFLFVLSLATVTSIMAQSKKSSGVVELNMAKKPKAETEQKERNVSSTTFTPVKPVKKETQTAVSTAQPQPADGKREISWLSPSLNSINTSRGEYLVKAFINSDEDLRVVNIFNNGEYQRNVIVNSGSRTKVGIDEAVGLHLGINEIKLEAITVSGSMIESSVYINYDISTAKFYALIIAVEDYNDPKITDLDQPVEDASKFHKILTTRYTFDEKDVIYLKNPTKAEIIGTLHKMRGVIKEDDNLLIYYAGHGYYDEEMATGYWLPSDAEIDNPVNWLPNTDITNYLSVLNTKHTLLIADACFSGGIFKTRKAFTADQTIEKLYKLPSRKAMTSGNLSEVPDRSEFVHYLIKKLSTNTNKYWTSEELFSEIRTPVMQNSDNVPQYGTIQKVGDEGGDFVFILR